jgi:hypothetical protein
MRRVALAEEEADTCPQCGMLKVWCRDPEHQFAFEADPSTCFASEALARYRNTDAYSKMAEPTQAATQLAARFREGFEPDLKAGLDLSDVEVD